MVVFRGSGIVSILARVNGVCVGVGVGVCFVFCQAHHFGAFIQKHSSIITIFLSLIHSRVFV